MKIRTTLGAGVAAAAVAATVLGVATPALAAPTTGPWNTQVGDYNSGTAGIAVSGDGSTAFVVVLSGSTTSSLVPVDLTSGAAGTAIDFGATTISGSPAANGDTVAIAGYDDTYTPVMSSITDGTASAVTLPGSEVAGSYLQGVTSTADGFVAVGTVSGCLVTWTWAAADTTATEGTPACSDCGSLVPFAVTTAPDDTVYAAVADESDSTTEQLWNLSDSGVAPIDLPASLGSPVGMTVGADGTVYVAGSGVDGDSNTAIATIDPSDTSTIGVRGTGAYPSGSAQLGLVNGMLWLGTWSGIAVLDPADTTSYTPDVPAPTLNTDNGSPQNFVATTDADYVLLPSDAAFTDTDSSTAPGLLEIVAPTAPAPAATVSGTTASVTWDASANGGTTITSATVTPTDTTTSTTLTPVTTTFFADAGFLDGTNASVDVTGLTRGHSYTFAVTQGNGFFTSQAGTSTAVAVPLLATAKPSKVAVVGFPQVGSKLTIKTTGTWQTGATLTHAWYAGTTKVGTGTTYTPKAADVGKKVKVVVTGTAAGRSPSTVTSATVGPVSKPIYKVPNKPTITGTPKVGQILTAHIKGLPKGAIVKYQWAFNGGQFGGTIGRPSTKTTLKIPASVRRTRIEVIAIVSVSGYAPGTKMSSVTAVVK